MFGSDEVMVRSAWVTVMGLVEIGVGHRMVGLRLKWVVGCRRSLVFGFGEVMARSAWITVMGLVGHGMGHGVVGWFF
nr:hypothetical protein CFP56_79181 [Quercus suber]